MRRVHTIVTATLALALGLVAVLAATATPAQARTWSVPKAKFVAASTVAPADLDAFEDSLMAEINKARRSNSVRRIAKFDACTDRMAERWGTHMATTGAW